MPLGGYRGEVRV